MNLDTAALGAVNRLAHEGAQRAADRLTGLAGVELFAETTRVRLTPGERLAGPAAEGSAAVGIDFSGALSGRAVLACGDGDARHVVDALGLSAGDGVERSAVAEVGNVAASGCLDGWAADFEGSIDVSPPTYVEDGGRSLLASSDLDAGRALAFVSRLTDFEGDLDLRLYVVPDPDSAASLVASDAEGASIDFGKLATFADLTHHGAANVAENVGTLTDSDVTVDLSRLTFIPIENAPRVPANRSQVGVILELEGTPAGYVVILFEEQSARDIAARLVPESEPTDGFDALQRSAIREVGNIVTSGFVDGWANILDTAIEVSTPRFVHDLGPAIVDPVAARLGRRQEFAFFFDATVNAADLGFDFRLYALPDEAALVEALSSLPTVESGGDLSRHFELRRELGESHGSE